MGIGKASSEKKIISLMAISKATGISKRYLDQLAISLKNASLIRGRSGRGGGFTLSRPAADIKVSEILQAASGPVDIAECVTRPEICLQSEYCTCRLFLSLIHQRLNDTFNDFSLADLLNHGGSEKIKHALDNLDRAESSNCSGSDNGKESQEHCPSSC